MAATKSARRSDMNGPVLESSYKMLCHVNLPFQERQDYMHSFDIAAPVMKVGYEDYLEPVTQLLAAAGITSGIAHMTVDEKYVQPGCSQRRPGPHVDGHYQVGQKTWGHGQGGWNHFCNHLPIPRMPIIIASNVVGCRAWEGNFAGEPRNDGDLSHLYLGAGRILPADVGFLLSPDCIHESMVFDTVVARTFLRIALPVGSVDVNQMRQS